MFFGGTNEQDHRAHQLSRARNRESYAGKKGRCYHPEERRAVLMAVRAVRFLQQVLDFVLISSLCAGQITIYTYSASLRIEEGRQEGHLSPFLWQYL